MPFLVANLIQLIKRFLTNTDAERREFELTLGMYTLGTHVRVLSLTFGFIHGFHFRPASQTITSLYSFATLLQVLTQFKVHHGNKLTSVGKTFTGKLKFINPYKLNLKKAKNKTIIHCGDVVPTG